MVGFSISPLCSFCLFSFPLAYDMLSATDSHLASIFVYFCVVLLCLPERTAEEKRKKVWIEFKRNEDENSRKMGKQKKRREEKRTAEHTHTYTNTEIRSLHCLTTPSLHTKLVFFGWWDREMTVVG